MMELIALGLKPSLLLSAIFSFQTIEQKKQEVLKTKMMTKDEVEALTKEHLVQLLKDFDQFRKVALTISPQFELVRFHVVIY